MPEATVIHANTCHCTQQACARTTANDAAVLVTCQYCLTLDPVLPCPQAPVRVTKKAKR